MLFSRRDTLLGAVALTTLPAFPTFAASPRDAEVEAKLAAIAEEFLKEYPESATALGLDKDSRAGLKRVLTDRSAEGQQRIAARTAERLKELQAIDATGLGESTAISLDVVRTAHEYALQGFAFGFGDVPTFNSQWSYRIAPYAVAQNTGAFVEIPDLLDSNHSIANAADAEAYIDRLRSYARQLDGETGRLKADAANGVIAPDFLLDKTLKQMRSARAQPIPQWVLMASITRRTKDIPGDFAKRAEQIVTAEVAPAMDRQIAELAAHRQKANSNAGVWDLPQGEAYYAWTLAASTTSRMSPDEVHKMGLDQLKDLQSQMEVILKAQGLTKGTVGERLTALSADPKYLFPNTDAGRQQLLDFMQSRIDDIRTRLPRAFNTLVPAKLIVKRVPPEIEAGAPGAYAAAGTIDGSVPGNVYVNLEDTSTQPRFGLTTLAFHEGIPGHVWQGEYTYKLPLIRSLLAFNAYSEGWALYAEQLGDELGVYDDDPVSRLGYLQSIAFRACRLVVDTGLHAKRWTRDQAIQWFATTNGSPIAEVTSEVDRYCAWPGQACGYKVGHSEINRIRDKAKMVLGSRFDLKAFDDAVVLGGNVPLTVLERTIDRHISEWAA